MHWPHHPHLPGALELAFSRRPDSPVPIRHSGQGTDSLRNFNVSLESPASGHLQPFLWLRDELLQRDRCADLVGRMVLVERDQHPELGLLSTQACAVVRRALSVEAPELCIALHVYTATSARAIMACQPGILRCEVDPSARTPTTPRHSPSLKIAFDGALLRATCERLFSRARFALTRQLGEHPPDPAANDDLLAALEMQSVCLDHLCRVYVEGMVEAASGGDPLDCVALRSSHSHDGSAELATAVRAHVAHLLGSVPA